MFNYWVAYFATIIGRVLLYIWISFWRFITALQVWAHLLVFEWLSNIRVRYRVMLGHCSKCLHKRNLSVVHLNNSLVSSSKHFYWMSPKISLYGYIKVPDVRSNVGTHTGWASRIENSFSPKVGQATMSIWNQPPSFLRGRPSSY